MAGIYIHIPFCKQACIYCDFHFSVSQKLRAELLNAIRKEIILRQNYLSGNRISTIYFGGGTPSILTAEEINGLLKAIHDHYSVEKNAEITLEANPDDLTENYLRNLKSLGINRLSVGIQSFIDSELEWMKRPHNADQAITSIKLAQKTGFDNVTADLIYGSRFQSLQTWKKNLETFFSLNIPHLSPYNLTIEEKTILGRHFAAGKEPAVSEELSGEQFLLLMEMAEAHGYDHYEISNFGKPGFYSVHNSNYWKGEHYLGIGPSAHSYNGSTRQWNISNNTLYVAALAGNTLDFEIEFLTPGNQMNERIMTGLRTMWGIDLDQFKKEFGNTHTQELIAKAGKWVIEGKMRQNLENLQLTQQGKLFADRIAADLFFSD